MFLHMRGASEHQLQANSMAAKPGETTLCGSAIVFLAAAQALWFIVLGLGDNIAILTAGWNSCHHEPCAKYGAIQSSSTVLFGLDRLEMAFTDQAPDDDDEQRIAAALHSNSATLLRSVTKKACRLTNRPRSEPAEGHDPGDEYLHEMNISVLCDVQGWPTSPDSFSEAETCQRLAAVNPTGEYYCMQADQKHCEQSSCCVYSGDGCWNSIGQQYRVCTDIGDDWGEALVGEAWAKKLAHCWRSVADRVDGEYFKDFMACISPRWLSPLPLDELAVATCMYMLPKWSRGDYADISKQVNQKINVADVYAKHLQSLLIPGFVHGLVVPWSETRIELDQAAACSKLTKLLDLGPEVLKFFGTLIFLVGCVSPVRRHVEKCGSVLSIIFERAGLTWYAILLQVILFVHCFVHVEITDKPRDEGRNEDMWLCQHRKRQSQLDFGQLETVMGAFLTLCKAFWGLATHQNASTEQGPWWLRWAERETMRRSIGAVTSGYWQEEYTCISFKVTLGSIFVAAALIGGSTTLVPRVVDCLSKWLFRLTANDMDHTRLSLSIICVFVFLNHMDSTLRYLVDHEVLRREIPCSSDDGSLSLYLKLMYGSAFRLLSANPKSVVKAVMLVLLPHTAMDKLQLDIVLMLPEFLAAAALLQELTRRWSMWLERQFGIAVAENPWYQLPLSLPTFSAKQWNGEDVMLTEEEIVSLKKIAARQADETDSTAALLEDSSSRQALSGQRPAGEATGLLEEGRMACTP
eukprot:TRINITY_DN44140_c0_g2_i1.p1 TRINITY_DN44140_c0_g2~~TRINITY_DN44140_c0_g2_i1.p1  ORF type:complete len:748 (+),score=102.87 TRINITY_DN44140_c0_g2_i1:169-2412(+)